MKVLQICNKPPYPPVDGGCIAMNNTSRGLTDAGLKVKVLSVCTHKHPVLKEKIPITYYEKTNAEYIFIDTRIKVFDAIINLFTRKSYNIQRFYKKIFRKKLKEVLESDKYDIVLIESIFMAPYISDVRKYSDAKVVLSSPNVESLIWERLAREESGFFKSFYLKLLAKRLRKAEAVYPSLTNGVYTVTENDMKVLQSKAPGVPMQYIPLGIDRDKNIEKHVKTLADTVFHIGAMDWLPNIEGIEWLLQKVWPEVIVEYPNAKLHLAGKAMPDSFKKYKSESVIIEGEVADAAAFMADKAVMIVPLLSGSGMRVKIIEGMMMQKTVITTDVGIEGIEHTHEKDVIIANSADEFASAIVKCLKNPEWAKEIGIKAEINANKHYNNQMLAQKLHDFLKSLV